MGILLYVICCFSLAAFNIFSLYLIFDSLVNMCLGVFLLGFILYGILCVSLTWLSISFPMLGKFSSTISKYFLRPFLFLFFFWDPYIWNVVVFNVVSHVSETVLNSFHSFFFILLCDSYFHYFIFQVTYPFPASIILLLVLSRIFLISFIVLFIIVCLLFSSCRSLLNVSCIRHSIFKVLDHHYYHYSEFFFWWTTYLVFLCLVWWVFALLLHLLHISLSPYFA